MAIDLIDILRNSFTDKSYADISQHVGISTESTKNGLNALVPAVLGCILGNNTVTSATQPSWWNAMKEEYPYTDEEYIDTDNINKSSFLIKGREILSGMFRTNHDELVKSVGNVSGVPKEKSAGLIEVGVPLIIGYLSNWVRKKGWRFNELIANLTENKSSIVPALPAGISSAHFGLNNVNKSHIPETKSNITDTKSDFSETIESEIPTQRHAVKKNKNGLMWIIGLVVLALLLWYFLGNKSSVREIRKVRDEILVPDKNDSVADASVRKGGMGETYYDLDWVVMKD